MASAADVPVRARAAESLLAGQAVSEQLVLEAAEAAPRPPNRSPNRTARPATAGRRCVDGAAEPAAGGVRVKVGFRVNGTAHELDVEARTTLATHSVTTSA